MVVMIVSAVANFELGSVEVKVLVRSFCSVTVAIYQFYYSIWYLGISTVPRLS